MGHFAKVIDEKVTQVIVAKPKFFDAPQPFPSWALNNATWTWEAPIQTPNDGRIHFWNEDQQQWIPAES
jgi:hypothetical protein